MTPLARQSTSVDQISLAHSLVGAGLATGWYAASATLLVAGAAHISPVLLVLAALAANVAVVLVAVRWGGLLAAIPVGITGAVAIDWHVIPPTHSPGLPGADNAAALIAYVTSGMLLGGLAAVVRQRGTESERGRQLLGEEQAALRRVATIAAREISPDKTLAAVAAEVRHLFGSDIAALVRIESDSSTKIVSWSSATNGHLQAGEGLPCGAEGVIEEVRRTHRPASNRRRATTSVLRGGAAPSERDGKTIVGSPVIVASHLWGVMLVCAGGDLPVGGEIEGRTSEFTELVSIAISSAQARVELEQSRARIVARSDEARRMLERDLHDGVQQQLVSLALQVRLVKATSREEATMAALDDLAESVVATVEDLRELSRGLHPAILASGGLRPALATLVRGSMVPARLHFTGEVDVPEGAEIAAFYVVSEALTNIAKHAAAQQVQVDVSLRSTELHLRVADDGCGGAALGGGTGLIGLTDRVQALGGDLEIVSSPKTGTALTAIIPYVHSSLHDSVSAARHPTTDPSR